MNIEERIECLVKVQESHDAEITRLVEATASERFDRGLRAAVRGVAVEQDGQGVAADILAQGGIR